MAVQHEHFLSQRPMFELRGMKRLVFAFAWLLALVAQRQASADDAVRGVHVGVGVGGFVAATGPVTKGYAAEFDLYPGGKLGRFGTHITYKGFDGFADGLTTVGVAFEAGASRPKLVMALHAGVGVTFRQVHPVIEAGVQTQLTFFGPLGIGLGGSASLIYDGIDSSLVLSLSAVVRVGR